MGSIWIAVVHSGKTQPPCRFPPTDAAVTDDVRSRPCLSCPAHSVPALHGIGLSGRLPHAVPSAGHAAHAAKRPRR